VGYFGSYARGDWGPGSDLDVVIVVGTSESPFLERGSAWDLAGLPVPVQVLVYTREEWRALLERKDRFARMMAEETVWVLERDR
jgi:predicted nucleotidyltransferase